jgi:hypothetical protein
MRCNPALINLRDKPPRTRRSFYSQRRTPSGDGFSRVCACALIVGITLACFWVYGLITHRDSGYVSLSLRAHALEYPSDRLSAPAALAPDMNSDAVRYANADVPAQLQRPEQKPEPNSNQKSAPNKAKYAAVPHRKTKATVIARRPLKPPMQAYAWGPRMQTYAWGPRTFQGPFRGY